MLCCDVLCDLLEVRPIGVHYRITRSSMVMVVAVVRMMLMLLLLLLLLMVAHFGTLLTKRNFMRNLSSFLLLLRFS